MRAESTSCLFKYYGGKGHVSHRLVALLPEHRVYVEPFGGGAGLLLRKPKAPLEVYNDLDGDLVNLFRVVRDRPEELSRKANFTPWGRAQFLYMKAWQPESDVDRALKPCGTCVPAMAGTPGA